MKRFVNWVNTFTPAQRHNILLIKLAVLLFLFLGFARVDVTVQSAGVIVPEGHVYSLDSMITGQIERVNFQQGDRVRKGDVIVVISGGTGFEPYNITANIDGIIQSLNYKNAGAVVKQGNPVVLLVPENRRCEVEAKLMIRDRGYIQKGQSVKVRLNSADAMRFAPITGSVVSISPDAVQSREGNYYTVRISLSHEAFTNGTEIYKVVPGIDVIAQIVTGDRTVGEYVFAPIISGFGNALQEK
jgi:multidrug resistance efflux pump